MKAKPKLQFALEDDPVPTVEPAPTPKPPVEERQQVGARVPKDSYRQLKSRAALEGVAVQALVERAISEFLARG